MSRSFIAICLALLAFPACGETIAGHASIVDGDTLKLDGARVRLFGIDAPESRQTCETEEHQWPCGRSAATALSDRVGGRLVSCERKATDRYRRMVAVCRVEGGDLGREMVRDGWALAFRRYSRAYVPDETEAHAAKRGMWRGDFTAPWEWRRMHRTARIRRL